MVIRYKNFDDGDLHIKTKSGYPLRFKVQENPGYLFNYSIELPKFDIYICGNTPGEVVSKIVDTVLSKYRKYAGKIDILPRAERKFCKIYEKRFVEV